MQHYFVNVHINRGANASTSCESLVKIGPVTSECKRANIANCATTRPQFDNRRSFATWRSETDWNIAILISAGQSAIISIHRVKFGEIV